MPVLTPRIRRPQAALLLLAVFLLLTCGVLASATAGLDAAALHLAQQWRAANPRVEVVMRDFSGVGSGLVLTLGTLAAAGFLCIEGRARHAAFLGLAMGSGELAVTALKHLIGRARPDAAFAAFVQDGLSFPSIHAAMSALFFLSLAALLAERQASRPLRAYLMAVAVLCTGLIGLSRVALGVHWASDVLAGWAFGAGWAALWFSAARRWEARADAGAG